MGLWSSRIGGLTRRGERPCFFFPHVHQEEVMWGQSSHPPITKTALPGNRTLMDLDLGLPASRSVTNECLFFFFFKHPVCGILLWQPEQTNTGRKNYVYFRVTYSVRRFVLLCFRLLWERAWWEFLPSPPSRAASAHNHGILSLAPAERSVVLSWSSPGNQRMGYVFLLLHFLLLFLFFLFLGSQEHMVGLITTLASYRTLTIAHFHCTSYF